MKHSWYTTLFTIYNTHAQLRWLILGAGFIIGAFVPIQATVALDKTFASTGNMALLFLYSSLTLTSMTSIATKCLRRFGIKSSLVFTALIYGCWGTAFALNWPTEVLLFLSVLLGGSACVFWTAIKTQLALLCHTYSIPPGEGAARQGRSLYLCQSITTASIPLLFWCFPISQAWLVYQLMIVLAIICFLQITPVSNLSVGPQRAPNTSDTLNSTHFKASISAFNAYLLYSIGGIFALKQLSISSLGHTGLGLGAVFFVIPLLTAEFFGKCCDLKTGPSHVLQLASLGSIPALLLMSSASYITSPHVATIMLLVGLILLTVAFSAYQTGYLALQIVISHPKIADKVSSLFFMVRNISTISCLLAALWLPLEWLFALAIFPMLVGWYVFTQLKTIVVN